MVGMISRRGFLQASSAAALLTNTASAKQLKSVGVQLYTVRSVLPKKPAETLKAIEAIGYREVEATYDNLDKIWPSLQATSLKPVSVHLNEGTIMKGTDDDIARAVDKVKQHGFSYAVFPWINPPDRGGLDKMKALAEKLNKTGEKCRAAGLDFCYHNHAFEFEPMDGTTRFQVLLDTLDKNLVSFEIDCFWVSVAGHDPVDILKKVSGRVHLLHLKDKAQGTPVMYKETVAASAFKEVGHGVLDWPPILRAAESAGVQHYFVEQDQTPSDPVESLRQSFDYISKLNF
jgi:sugar phosphate isomerase/epimerase